MAIYDGPALLAKQLTKQAHLLVPGLGNQQLSENARTVLKVAFNDSLENESKSFPHLSQLMASLTPETAPTTRSASKKKKQQQQQTSTAVAKLDKTPLDALTLDGLDDETVWEQMELRNKTVDSLLGDMFGTNGVEEQGSDDGAEFDDQSESDEVQDMLDGEEEDSEVEQDEEDSEEEDYESEEYSKQLENDAESGSEDDDVDADARRIDLNLDNFDKPLPSSSKKRRGPASAVDDDFFSLAEFHKQTDEGEFEMERALRGEADDDEDDDQDKEDDFDLFADVGTLQDDDDEEEGDLDEAGIMYSDFFDPPTRRDSKKVAQRKQTKGKKAGPVTNGKKRPSSAVEKASNEADAEVVEQEPPRKKTKVRFSDAVRVKTIAPRKQTAFEKLAEQIGEVKARQAMEESLVNGDEDGEDEDDYVDSLDLGEDESGEDEDLDDDAEAGSDLDEEEQDEEEDDDEDTASDLEQEAEAIDRFESDLFAEDDDEDEGDKANLSKQERKLMALSSQIAALEAENVGPKNWATRGEAKAKDRPVNSLLEEDLEFERAGKVVPIITEETTKTIEDIIKQRILDNNFDDVERRRPVDPNAFLPSRYLEVQDTKSGKSLAEIYEEDFVSAREREAGRKVTHALDADLEKKHKEIEDLFEDLSGKLDALSNAHFTPKPPKATITTISNLPAISMESAMPTTQSSAARLAPEEVHVPDPADADRSDLTPAQKRAERQKKRKQRAEQAKKREQFVSDKEKARKSLLGTRGVTVLGKAGNVNGNSSSQQKKKQKKDAKASQTVPSSVAMKL